MTEATDSTRNEKVEQLRSAMVNMATAIVQSIDAGCMAAAQLRLLEDGTGVAYSSVDREAFLRLIPPAYVLLLLEHLPTLAGPWKTVDMRNGEPTKMERAGYRGPIAQVRLRSKRWLAVVGSSSVEYPGETLGWPTREEAMNACDRCLARQEVIFHDFKHWPECP